jgi:hypothetical protein
MKTSEKYKYVVYHFTFRDVAFKSRVQLFTDIHDRVNAVGEEKFIQLNQDLLKELWSGDMSPENIEKQLKRLNEHGSRAFIEIA